MIETLFQTSISFRTYLVDKLSSLDDETLDATPEGFETSIRWNVAHMIATPVLLTYELVGQTSPFVISRIFTIGEKRNQSRSF